MFDADFMGLAQWGIVRFPVGWRVFVCVCDGERESRPARHDVCHRSFFLCQLILSFPLLSAASLLFTLYFLIIRFGSYLLKVKKARKTCKYSVNAGAAAKLDVCGRHLLSVRARFRPGDDAHAIWLSTPALVM